MQDVLYIYLWNNIGNDGLTKLACNLKYITNLTVLNLDRIIILLRK